MNSKISAALALVVGALFVAPGLAQAPRPSPLEPRIDFEEANRRANEPRWLSLNYAEFDTRGDEPVMAADLRAGQVGATYDYYIVQFDGPITDERKARVSETGAELLDYMPNYAFIVRASERQMAEVRSAAAVVWDGRMHPAYRIETALRLASEDPAVAGNVREMVVHAFAGVDRELAIAQVFEAGAVVVAEFSDVGHQVFEILGTAAVARRIARSPDLRWVENQAEMTQRNNTMQWVVQTFSSNNRKVWDNGLHGEGQVVGHMDGSIRTSSCYFADPNGNPIGQTHRKIVYNSGGGSDLHGTHTAGTSVGDAFPVNGSTQNRGMAYLAKIAHTTAFPSSGFKSIATTHANNGARVHTNSWGNDGTTAYNTLCNSIDSFQWEQEDNLVLFAATNQSTLRNPENAKNLIAVEASRNGGSANQKCSGGIGPTADGRRKPEVLAPGCSIVSAGTGSCSTASLSGTSMACPGVTGACALIRQYFTDGYYPSGSPNAADEFVPTGALVKAVAINTSQDMTGVGGYPSNSEGWGRINLDESLFFAGDSSKLFAQDVRKADGLTTGQMVEFTVTVSSTTEPLEMTLAFHDFPGTINSSNPVINDLDLEVTEPNGTTVYKGNVFSGGWSNTGGSFDAKNNVERVAVETPATGLWTVRITAKNVPQGPQGYAFVASGDVGNGPPPCDGSLEIYCTAKSNLVCGTPTIDFIGKPSATQPSGFFVFAYPARGNKGGLMLYSDGGRATIPFQGGLLCVEPTPLRRTSATTSGGTTGQCDGEFFIDMNAFAQGLAGGNPASYLTIPGTFVGTQWWGRDTVATGSFLSNALEYEVCP